MASTVPPKSPGKGRMPIRPLPSTPSPHAHAGARRSMGASGLPPPPMVTGLNHSSVGQPSQYSQSISKSLTIEEMRQLHQRALSDAEAKRTELRLVLASRYRELVGSSDEVQKMRERAQELNDLVHALPSLMQKLVESTSTKMDNSSAEGEKKEDEEVSRQLNDLNVVRRDLSVLPRVIHRYLDKDDVHGAAVCLIRLFCLIGSQSKDYPLATALTTSDYKYDPMPDMDIQIQAKTKMIFLYTQTLPEKILRLSKRILLSAASYGSYVKKNDATFGAQLSAKALSALDLLDVNDGEEKKDRAVRLLDLYFDSKAQLLQVLLNQLVTPGTGSAADTSTTPKAATSSDDQDFTDDSTGAHNAEAILSKIVLILQYDVVLHPYQIFVLGNFPVDKDGQAQDILSSLPKFDSELVKSRCSSFLAAHLPLIRTKVKSILVSIAGTTASALGQIRQSLYDKTDGIECIERLDSNGCCTWEQAVHAMVDVRIVLSHGAGNIGGFSPIAAESSNDNSFREEANGAVGGQRFSLWSALFSATFTSLVHSLLTTSFHSVHKKVVSTLRTSLANAPPVGNILPHEAYRNTLRIATELDGALLKVSEDAHELLVHAEERVQSQRRLRLSLYVQTCEIMGRLVLELRMMLQQRSKQEQDATKDLIVGRLCYLLKFRLTSLPTLLDSDSSPAVIQTSSGMITLVELQSAFELADDNDDGLITFEEAMEAVDSAFAGTQFHGAEMVRETLLLSSAEKDSQKTTGGASTAAPVNVTLNELALLTARGLRHETKGSKSALGTVQKSLDDIVKTCFQEWAKSSLSNPIESINNNMKDFLHLASTTSEAEWQRIYHQLEGSCIPPTLTTTPSMPIGDPKVDKVSPHVVGYLLNVSGILNRTVFPSDSFLPIHSPEYASSLGLVFHETTDIPTMKDTIQWALLQQALILFASNFSEVFESVTSIDQEAEEEKCNLSKCGPSALVQLQTDIAFILLCFCGQYAAGVDELRKKFMVISGSGDRIQAAKSILEKAIEYTDSRLGSVCGKGKLDLLSRTMQEKHQCVLEDSDLFLSALFKVDSDAKSPSSTGQQSFGSEILSGSQAASVPLLHNPLASSRRFGLLPIQADRSINEVQLRKFKDNKQESDSRQDKSGSSRGSMKISTGLNFFSSMLKTK